jgi:MAP/microtubule affinity-regulating kinase
LKKPNKHLLTYAFSNPPPKVQKPRPKTELPKIPKETNRVAIKPKTTLNKVVPVTKRPLTSYKKYETEFKANETSLSTQASSLFKGRVEDYAIGKEIGKGAYAIVKQALHKPTNMKVAVKIYEKCKLTDPQRNSSVKKEIQILQKIDHSNIVKLHEVIATTKQVCK